MLGDLAILDTEDVDRHHGLRTPAEIAAVDENVVAFGHREAGFVLEICRKVAEQPLDCGRAVRDLRIVLPIVVAEQAVEHGRIAIDEDPLDPGENEFLVGFGSIRRRHDGVLPLRAVLVLPTAVYRVKGTNLFLYKYRSVPFPSTAIKRGLPIE